MNATKRFEIDEWIYHVNTAISQPQFTQPRMPTPPDDSPPTKKPRFMNAMDTDLDLTPARHARLQSPDSVSATFTSNSGHTRSAAPSTAAGSRQGPSKSPVKQLKVLQSNRFVCFCNFDDNRWGTEPEDVTTMRDAIQQFADGIGILGYSDEALAAVVSDPLLTRTDKRRFQFTGANKPDERCALGSMPALPDVKVIVEAAQNLDQAVGAGEDNWNTEVHYPFLMLARNTSKHANTIKVQTVKSVRIEPASILSGTDVSRRVVDYVVVLQSDNESERLLKTTSTLPGEHIRSWNPTTNLCEDIVAISIETKSSMTSWAEGKPQVGVWSLACFRRLTWIGGNNSKWPSVPLLIVQGHDWRLLVASWSPEGLVVREAINFGSTRSYYDVMKLLAALHWLMDWAERVWRPWVLSLA